MFMKRLFYGVLFTSAFLLIGIACKKSTGTTTTSTNTCDGTAATYNANVKSILDGACTASGCHPTYNSYSGIKSILTSGDFKREVITNKTMPSGSSLTSAQLNILKCWSDAGFPEK